ncbi:MAG: ArnT family glycosyltransferase [Candidatus Binatia bacterium]
MTEPEAQPAQGAHLAHHEHHEPHGLDRTSPRGRQAVALAAILLLALAIRVWGIDFGLPYSYHNDEGAIVRRALSFGLGDLNPRSFHWPAFHLYVLFGLYAAIYAFGAALGTFASTGEFAGLYFRDPTVFYLAGRALSAFAGTATVYVTYRAARRLDSTRAGLWAALCLALTYYHVRDSHLATLDVPATFWTALAFLAAVEIDRGEASRWNYARAGIFAGLATATKYNSGIVFLAIATAHTLRWPRPPLRHLALAAAAAAATFAVATPFNWIDWPTFARDFAFQQRHLAEGQWGLTSGSALAYYGRMLTSVQLRNTETFVFDPMVLLFVTGALASPFLLDRRAAALVLVVPLAYLCYIGTWAMAATRYLDPIFPMLSIGAGSWIARRKSRAGIVLVALLLALSLRASVLSDWTLSRKDTRTEAKEWIEAHIPPGTRIALESYTPPLAPSASAIEARARSLESGELQHPTQPPERVQLYYRWLKETAPKDGYDLVALNDSLLDAEAAERNRVPETNYDLERLRSLGVQYVIVSSFLYGRYRNERASKLYPALVAFYRTLEREHRLIKEFRPGRLQPGPVLRVYSMEKRS